MDRSLSPSLQLTEHSPPYFPFPPSHQHYICTPTPYCIYVASTGPLWPTFNHYKSLSNPCSLAIPATSTHPTRLRLYPRPGTARWLGFANLSTSSTALTQASALSLPPPLRYVGMHRLVEALIRAYVDNPHTPLPPQQHHEELEGTSATTMTTTAAGATPRPSVTSPPPEEVALREVLVEVVHHLTRSWWVPSAAFISMVSVI